MAAVRAPLALASYDLYAVLRRLGELDDGLTHAVFHTWPLVPLLVTISAVVAWVGRFRTAAVCLRSPPATSESPSSSPGEVPSPPASASRSASPEREQCSLEPPYLFKESRRESEQLTTPHVRTLRILGVPVK